MRGIAAFAGDPAVGASEVAAHSCSAVSPSLAEDALQAAGGGVWSYSAVTGRERRRAIRLALAA